ncbi:GNAT family N-acetyltransferase [Roseospira marina]|uniref:GNAT family N-acetyltransferase n=1 Tax=Roseospira marina TaxID=140057 RepID=A0A5M6IAV8_9PROT|nr:peptidase C39 family protein [Roseospira marina]KAA5605252.1 GNAT family N-acetyltransferase [Roseospira marina]MBB4314711.1 ribosomal-protein-alanine acetyltransferase [Roseospira marina]MBB5087700.1 ribosomal-protein-alanine acetyltransferase [Roseospira marina]
MRSDADPDRDAAAPPVLRPARLEDLDALVRLEAAAFETDRLSRRSFRRFIEHGRADCTLAEVGGRLLGYALILFRDGTALARLYSIAVTPDARGQGIGAHLVRAAEAAALERDCVLLRLEVRADNGPAQALYRRLGYRPFGRLRDYYEDHADAVRMQRALRAVAASHTAPPYYAQTTDFTCGPAALMMALAALKPGQPLDRRTEFRLWREATTIFMAAGHGGCEPFGLALAAVRRGLRVRVHVNQPPPYFLDSVRDPDKRDVMVLTQADFGEQAAAVSMPIHESALTMAELRAALDGGAVAVLLVSHYRMLGDRAPHWVLVFGHDGRRALVHDPWVEPDDLETPLAAADLPIPWSELDRMARYGRRPLQAALILEHTAALAPESPVS